MAEEIPLYKDKKYVKLLETVLKKLKTGFEKVVVEKYVEKFGYYEGICKFAETFKLVHILKTTDQVKDATGVTLEPLVINDVKFLNITYG